MIARTHRFRRSHAILVACATLLAVACGGEGAVVPEPGPGPGPAPGGTTGPDINSYPPMANDAPPGASPRAFAIATALGRGVNYGNTFEAPREGAWGVSATDDIIDKTAAAGFTSVRLPVRWSAHASATPPFTIDPVFFARIETVVDKLLAKSMYVVLNMHHYAEIDGGTPSAGEIAVATNLAPVRFVMMWEQIATRFQGHSDKLVFELYNEPHGPLNGEPWNLLAARTLGAVRKINPTRAVMIGPTSYNNAGDLPKLKLPNDANIIATVHNYSPFSFTHQGAEWQTPIPPVGITCCSAKQISDITGPLDAAKTWADAKRYPMFVGEFGAYNKADMASRVTFNRTMRDAVESRGMTWAYWEFASGFGVYDPTERTFRASLLESLLGK